MIQVFFKRLGIYQYVIKTLKAGGFPADTLSVIAGLSNDYGDYVATYEEYQIQRYEGASEFEREMMIQQLITILNFKHPAGDMQSCQVPLCLAEFKF
ncbi:neutral ceramidase 3-like [Gigantopelta aegis]|uniref:neutral ceramidase 3-like n=1 Tax=Gigantopelta aegis TaxID=1735272 RepID=UPI001B88D0F9|nr:neutral ceramidase 3-like [Gigantopelta aegis]